MAVEINGSVVLDRDSNLLAFGAILRHRPPLDQDEEVGGGGRTAAAISALTIRHGFDGERGRTTFVSSEESLHLDALSFSHGLALGPPFFAALRISEAASTPVGSLLSLIPSILWSSF